MRRNKAARAASRATAGPLASQAVVQPQTAALQSRAISGLAAWLASLGLTVTLSTLLALPDLIDRIVEGYGEHLYRENIPLYVYLAIITSIQRLEPQLHHKLNRSWDIARRWERLEPYDHRAPIPTALVKALIVGAVSLGWLRWAGVTALAFYGPARIGEVLKSKRCHLLLQQDTLGETAGRVLVHVAEPKSRFRGGARQQHFSVRTANVVAFIEVVFRDLAPQAPLYPFADGAYRKRWDRLMATLSVPQGARLLPGGLRGGGAIHYYTDDVPIADLQWRMRLRSAMTLEHYLQETAAVTTLMNLPAEAQETIKCLASLFEPTLSLLAAGVLPSLAG